MSFPIPCHDRIAELRALVGQSVLAPAEQVMSFEIAEMDGKLSDGGLRGEALHEVAAASTALADDAAATLFVAGIVARFASEPGAKVMWALTRFDLYAPGLEQAGLGPGRALFAQGREAIRVQRGEVFNVTATDKA